jgi:dTDP-4-amino-4,6-dideoxygalactose transaminase
MNFNTLFEFEQALAEYTGAPFVVATDCCTHAIELCMRIDNIHATEFTAFTYLSIPQLMKNLNIDYQLTDEYWIGEYQFHGTNIWDSARRLERNMYRVGQKQCLSFGYGKPLQLGRCGAILLDSANEYKTLSRWRSDGRDLQQSPWQYYTITKGYHYCPTLEICKAGIKKLPTINVQPIHHPYPDCRLVNFV